MLSGSCARGCWCRDFCGGDIAGARSCDDTLPHFFFSSGSRHTRWPRDWSSDVCSSDLGARDHTPPRTDAGVTLPGRIWFAGDAPGWGGGGVAFYDHEVSGRTSARAYLITAGQFTDVHTQEGPLYSRLVQLGTRDGLPMMTFTAPHGIHDATHTRPSEQYLDTLRVGLREAHNWDD